MSKHLHLSGVHQRLHGGLGECRWGNESPYSGSSAGGRSPRVEVIQRRERWRYQQAKGTEVNGPQFRSRRKDSWRLGWKEPGRGHVWTLKASVSGPTLRTKVSHQTFFFRFQDLFLDYKIPLREKLC